MIKRVLLAVLAFSAVAASAKVTLPGIFSDHAVLAKKAKVPVFGKAEPGEKVTVVFNGQKKMALADRNGKWRVDLDLSNSPEGPFELKINDIVIKDVIVGEVWLCSGQSNMAWVLQRSEGFEEAKKNPVGSRLRSFVFSLKSNATPSDALDGKWVYADAANVGSFSGVGYFFGKKLLSELNTPVGLIRNAWGGAPIEAWMTTAATGVVPAVAERDAQTSKDLKAYPAKRKQYLLDHAAWAKKNKRLDTVHQLPPADAKWKSTRQIAYSNSITWFKKSIVSKENGRLTFAMQRQATPFTVWVDGKKVYEWSLENAVLNKYPRFVINGISAGKHEVMFRIYYPLNNSRRSFNLQMSIGGVNLDGQAWDVYQEVVFKNKVSKAPQPVGATPREFFNSQRLFNGCIYPMLPYALDGVIWYQGETNVGRYKEYAALQRALIADWRKHFEDPELPFYWCSLAAYRAKNANANAEESIAYLRGAQTETLDVPGTGQAILTDAGDAKDIHPRNKLIPGERLAAIALAKVYGKQIPYLGPSVEKVVREGGKLRIHFKDTYGGLVAAPVPEFYYLVKRNNDTAPLVRNSPGTQLEGFAVCGKENKWYWADEAVIDGNTVVVSSSKVAEPVHVRFGWQNNPTVNLYNKAGFPGVPFMSK